MCELPSNKCNKSVYKEDETTYSTRVYSYLRITVVLIMKKLDSKGCLIYPVLSVSLSISLN